jgi:hypothetical protein
MTLCIHMPAMGPSSVGNMLLRGYAAFLSSSAVFTGNLLFVSAAVRQAPSSESSYVAPNGVTVMCPGVAVGDTFDINDLTYTRVDLPTLQSLVSNEGSWPQLATSCTTGVTNMSALFYVRVPPPRVMLLQLRRRPRPSPIPSLRDRRSLHTAARPSPRCRPLPSISPSAIGT